MKKKKTTQIGFFPQLVWQLDFNTPWRALRHLCDLMAHYY